MHPDNTLELAREANALARRYHPDFYTSLHTLLADLPATDALPGGPCFRRAAKVWYAEAGQVLQLVYAESVGDDAALLAALVQGLDDWAALDEHPADGFGATPTQCADLLALATHQLTSAAERRDLLQTLLGWHSRRGARALAARLTAAIDARSPGVLTGRGWLPHGPAEAKPSPHPFPAAA